MSEARDRIPAQAQPIAGPPARAAEPEKPQLPVQVFQEMERRDENQILAEMRGDLIEDLVYSIDIQGRRVTNLSYAGVKEAIRRRGNLEILEVRTEENAEETRALVRVRDHENRIDVLGASSADKKKPFAYTLAVNKAERNAFAKLIPAKWYAVLIDEYLQRRQSKPITGEREERKPQPVEEPWQIKVPVVKDPIAVEGVRQFPLVDGTRALGMLNALVDGSEISIIPEKPVSADSPPIRGFLVRRILDAMKTKHPGFDYRLDMDQNSTLRAVLIRGKLGETQIKELASASRWSFLRAMEPQPAKPESTDSRNA